jgi:hypothetical protein
LFLRNYMLWDKHKVLQYFMTYEDPGLRMREHLLTAPSILVIWVVAPYSYFVM